MGYETKLIVGKACHAMKEWKLTNVPYSDGSGFEPERDGDGEIVGTGRIEQYFMVMAEIDLCKTDYDGPLHALHKESIKRAKELAANHVVYFYGTDGNTQIKEDLYGDPFSPVRIETVLKVLKTELEIDPDYRRFKWAAALLESMANDSEELEVIFYGH